MPYADGSYDAVWTQHSSMNIADKERLYAEIARVLRPGGRLALYEIMAGSVSPIHFPVPWARQPDLSQLRQPEAVRGLLHNLGFREEAWIDISEKSVIWFASRPSAPSGGPPPLGLHLLLGADFPAMFQNQVKNLQEDRVRVIQGVFTRLVI